MALGIYVHLPFCPYICPYCDFAKWPMRRSVASGYLEALHAEIDIEPKAAAKTIFLGGGTPNAYGTEEIGTLIAHLRERFDGATPIAEISIEVNPDLLRDRDFEAYRDCGINRVSIGVQSFDPHEIATLGRKHTVQQIAEAVESARRARMRSVSLDLIFAVPGQTAQSWQRSLECAIRLGVDHISTYGLTIEEGTPYAAWQQREPRAFLDEEREAELYEIAITMLERSGYRQYEISNFARPGHESMHNSNYWANGDYIGLGVGAASYRGGTRSVHTRNLEEYVAAASAGRPIPSEGEHLEGMKAAGEAIMLALRTAQGVGLATFRERYGIDVLERYAQVVRTYREAGLLEQTQEHLRLTKQGRFLANDVCGAFITFE